MKHSGGEVVTRRTLLVTGTGLATSAVVGGSASAEPRPRSLVRGSTATSVVVHADDAAPAVLTAVAELRDYVARITGITLPVASLPSDPPSDGLAPIYVGLVGRESDTGLPAVTATLDPDGYVVDPRGRSLTIIGGSPWGTLNGVYAYLESVAGVAWLLPGPIGEHVPSASTVTLPAQRLIGTPGFAQRMMSPMVDDPANATGNARVLGQWAQRNRLQGKHNQAIAFHHNLHTLFPVSEFGTTHPEYYANSTPPEPGVTTYWQPAFSVPGTIDVAVDKINAYFTAHPEARSFSLGVNDGGGFAEADPVAAYYTWVNAVVERVLQVHPDKWFGLLAYVELERAPSFALHPRVVPFFTQDRMAWADPAVEAASKARLDGWHQVAASLGFYDYTYGSPYVLPRVTPTLSGEKYRYAKSSGVIGHYEEIYANWAEGPKPWLNAKLMWDPTADVETLLDEWYHKAVGADAAPHLRAYYQLWEDFWTTAAIHSSWFKPGATYQAFNSAGYVNALSPVTLAAARTHIDAVLAHPGSTAQQARAQRLARGFDYYEASALSFPRTIVPPSTSAAALEILEDLEANWAVRREAAAARRTMLVEFESDPILRQPLNAFNYGLAWTGWNRDEFWRLVDHLTTHEASGGPVTAWLQARTGEQHLFGQFCRLVLGIATGSATSLLQNGSFEQGNQNWQLWIASSGTLAVNSNAARTGTAGLRASGVTRGGPAQVFPVSPGLLVTRAWVRATGEPAGHVGTVQFNINLQSATGAQLGVVRAAETRIADTSGWFPIESLDEIPAELGGTPVAKVQYVLVLDNQAADPALDIDDIVACQAI